MTAKLILIVEDNERNAKLLRDVLGATGYRTHDTTTAEEGLEFARKERPALIHRSFRAAGLGADFGGAGRRANLGRVRQSRRRDLRRSALARDRSRGPLI